MLKTSMLAVSVMLLFSGSAVAGANDTTVDVVAPFEITGLDPAKSGDIFLRMGIVETLVESDKDGNPVPALAKSWIVSPDGTSVRFTLQQGVSFHDGSVLAAKDVARALNVARGKPGRLPRFWLSSLKAGRRYLRRLPMRATPSRQLSAPAPSSSQVSKHRKVSPSNALTAIGAASLPLRKQPISR